MVEGSGSRDYPNVKSWALGNPDGFQKLIDLLVDATTAYLIRQIEAGAEVLQLFDTWAGVLPKHAFDRFSAAPICNIARRVKKVHPDIPIIAFLGARRFICLNSLACRRLTVLESTLRPIQHGQPANCSLMQPSRETLIPFFCSPAVMNSRNARGNCGRFYREDRIFSILATEFCRLRQRSTWTG